MVEYISNSEDETINLGKKLGSILEKGSILLLSGDLGAGKTVLTRGIARGLGINDYITSPTFTLIHQYEGRIPLYHFDIYRLQEADELYELGYEEYFYGDGITIVEWPERMDDLSPNEYLEIKITKTDKNEQRIITINAVGSMYKKIEEASLK